MEKSFHIRSHIRDGDELVFDPYDVGAFVAEGGELNQLSDSAMAILTGGYDADLIAKCVVDEKGLKVVDVTKHFHLFRDKETFRFC